MAVARSTGSARSKGPDSGATLSSVYEEAETEEPEAEKLVRKRSRAEIAATTPPAKKAATGQPIGKKGSLRSLYQFSSEAVAKKPEVEVKKAPSRPKFNIIPLRTATVEGEASGAEKHAEKPVDKDARKDASGKKPRQHSSIRAEDTLGDIYSKTYDESRANEPHAPVWNLKQKDTFIDFGACREWYLGAFPPAEVDRQKERLHDNLYRSYVMGQANANSAGHQILREWRPCIWKVLVRRSTRSDYLLKPSSSSKLKSSFRKRGLRLIERRSSRSGDFRA
ncbi:hypothetical protein HanHA300_Chr11g0398141 [Helianthus annuus]|nr:hypothetical protein HanHA300_Chr11g0398141 [Helianthus annuus]KAJ0517099.1 hypothetical protein HanHA89_Chr11g0421431 [Helianthus annuus]KAJ0874748.1 hypothetical protein HanPSC8_Chr11g0467971 [Helianthus annuus]